VTTVNGTGFIVSQAGLVLTNQHVIAQEPNMSSLRVTGGIGSREAPRVKLNFLAQSPQNDLAILQLADTSKNYSSVLIGNPWTTKIGDELCSMGLPFETEYQATQGPLGGKGGGHGLWFTQMPSNPGESGAPVFTASDGKVVALKLGDYDMAQSLSYVIPINMASSLLRDYAGIEVPPAESTGTSATPSGYLNTAVQCTPRGHPFARGYCAVFQCPRGQWSRASASLLPGGTVAVRQGLETDSVSDGVCGWVQIELLDAGNGTIAYGYGPKRCIGPKSPGRARIDDFPPDHVQVPAPIANQVKGVRVTSVCAGDVFAPFGIGFGGDSSTGTLNVLIGSPHK